MFFGKTLDSRTASLHPGVQINGSGLPIDLSTDTATILNSIVSDVHDYGMVRGQTNIYLPPEHPIITI